MKYNKYPVSYPYLNQAHSKTQEDHQFLKLSHQENQDQEERKRRRRRRRTEIHQKQQIQQ